MIESIPLLHTTQLSVVEFLRQLRQWKSNVLGTFVFSMDDVDDQLQNEMAAPSLRVPIPRLDAGGPVCEIWQGSGKVTHGQFGAIQYRHDADVVLGVIALPETVINTGDDKNETPLQQTTDSAYQQIFALLDVLHYPYLYRCWNYIADITTHSFGLERYRQFNSGRQDAFLAHGRDVMGSAPAACAMGFGRAVTVQGLPPTLLIAFLAGRVAPRNIENPRQISAYLYPQTYGPRSPTFSRASLIRIRKNDVLFISGTASIVGYATLHYGNVVAQTHETMNNIKAVLDEANQSLLADQSKFNLSNLYYTVYVRRPADFCSVRRILTHCVGGEVKAVFLQADMCREDLLVEIEATGFL